MRELVAQVFVAFECDSCENRRCARVDFRDNVTSVGPHADHCVFNLFQECICFYLSICLVCVPLSNLFSATPYEIIESFLACHHFGHVCPIKTIDTVGAYKALLPQQNIALLSEMISGLMVDSKTSQVWLVY